MANIKRKAINYLPVVKVNTISDVDDNKFLELAETCNADFIITGNIHHFTMQEHKGSKILTPKEYWEIYLTT